MIKKLFYLSLIVLVLHSAIANRVQPTRGRPNREDLELPDPDDVGGDDSRGGDVTPNVNFSSLFRSPSFWCWRPCYCWYDYGSEFEGNYPRCWCWHPCGCWNRPRYIRATHGSGFSSSAIEAAGAGLSSSEAPANEPSPTSAPPSGRP
jgi:hypothetical protein